MFLIDVQSKTPIFEQLKKQILEFISIQVLSPNDKLPSVRSLASQLGVNPNTVAKAYQDIYTVKGKGCFISDNDTDAQIRLEKMKEFKDKVKEMKKYHIGKDGLYQTINEVYEEEYHD